jgi:beta-galactosidase
LGDADGAQDPGDADGGWVDATLPHTARLESLVTGEPGSDSYQWQGTCWYRLRVDLGPELEGRKVFLHFEAAMNVADVWLNGSHLGQHMGGWLPFGFDITDRVVVGGENMVSVRLDNTDNALTGPKPLAQLDFNPYHGLYRSVRLVIKDPLYVTDPILADRPASGGVFVTYPQVSEEEATVRVQVHVRNDGPSARTFRVHLGLVDPEGRHAAWGSSTELTLPAGSDRDVMQDVRVPSPALWSLSHPHLHTLHTQVVEDGAVVDEDETRIGIRRIEISAEGFRINGARMFLRGTNRHQEYPYLGYALSDAAQYRDAKKIKDAGFDYVRLSHYAHAPAFMDACDELGLVVMDCIPGWQFYNREDPRFTEIQLDNCRRLLRRDRNHPCVILWEVSLNESWMTDEFIAESHALAHREYPGDQCYTCGWTEGYDVFIQARQHGGCTEVTDRACLVSEYGDWEYYAQNAGLQQDAWGDLAADDANSRQLRWHGEAALLQQATNFQEAHNDNRKTLAFADGLWVMFDYNRGYAPDIESSGCMDLFRLPKLSHAFFQSQRAPSEVFAGAVSGPMVFVASYWTAESDTRVRVFSNCQEVALFRDGVLVARQGPDADRLSTHLEHPPYTFELSRFTPGTLEAVGYVAGTAVARHRVRTPGPARRLSLTLDEGGRPFAMDGKDVAFFRGEIQDGEGTRVPDAWENVFFGATGDIRLAGANPFSSDAGVASILVETAVRRPRGVVYALALIREGGEVRVLVDAHSVGGDVAPHRVRVTTDGSDPAEASPLAGGLVTAEGRVRAVLTVGGRPVVTADTDIPRFRIAGSVAPETEPEP